MKVVGRTEQWQGGPGTYMSVTFNDGPAPIMFFALGARGKPAEAVADEAAEQAIEYFDSGAAVDSHSADQIVLPLAFAKEASEFTVAQVTEHLRTNVSVIRLFLPREIEVEGGDDGPGVVRIAATMI